MKVLKKRIKSHVQVARANLDRAILDLKTSRLKPIRSKLEKSSRKVASDSDLAWVIAARVLDRVKGIRESLAHPKRKVKAQTHRPVKRKAVKRAQTARA